MDRFDRLTTLIDRFKLVVQPAPMDQANLVVLAGPGGAPETVLFHPRGGGLRGLGESVLFAAHVDWNGPSNPLMAALPATIELDLRQDPDGLGLVRVMLSEMEAQRCGVDSVLSRLGEVLIVRLMRARIEAGSARPGLLAGLADPRLSRAIVAMHDRPGRDWRNDDLAELAGLSRSRFAEMFLAKVGEPPAAYLRHWRLALARQDVARGDRIEAVARRYGFASSEGFSRAFKKQYGLSPVSLRRESGRSARPVLPMRAG